MSGFGERSFSSLGNSSLSTFLSALLEEEQINDFELVVDNAKLDHNKSTSCLKLLQDQPKCKWSNLVTQHSDRDLRHGRKPSKSSSRSQHANRLSIANHRSASDPNLSLQMPKRQLSPLQALRKKRSEKIAASTDSLLLRMPSRLPSPATDKGRLDSKLTKNATWENSELRKRNAATDNTFFDKMMEAEDHALKQKTRAASFFLKDHHHERLEENLIQASLVSSLSLVSPLSDEETDVEDMIDPSKSSRQAILSSDLRTTLISELSQHAYVATIDDRTRNLFLQ
jgi:hypothetical protein